MKLFLSPHQDDETLFGAYTLLREKPHVVFCFRDWKNYQIREEEARDALGILGIDYWTQLPIPDKDSKHYDPIDDLMNMLKCFPDVEEIWVPKWESDGGNGDHNIVYEAAMGTWKKEKITSYCTYSWPKGQTISRHTVPYDLSWVEIKKRALSCYRSQIENPKTAMHFQRDYSLEYYE